MKKVFRLLIPALAVLAVIAALAAPATAQQQTGGRDPQAEMAIYQRLAAVNPSAVPPFKIGTEAMDAGDLQVAKENFQGVLYLAPGFPDALRRLSYVEQRLGNLPQAEVLARQALQADPSPANQTALALVLIADNDKTRISEALTLAKAAVAGGPNVFYNYYVLLTVAATAEDYDTMRQGSRDLLKLDPVDPTGHYISGIVEAHDGHFEQAEKDLLMAEEFGYSKDLVDDLLISGIRAQANLSRILRWSGIGLGGWLGGLGLLFLAGLLLSSLTLKGVGRYSGSEVFKLGPAEFFFRGVYRLLIAVTSAYFYLSIPILILLIVVLVGAIIFNLLTAGQWFFQLALFVLIAGIYTLAAIVRSLVVRTKPEDLGRPVTPDEMPVLWELVGEVAQQLNTRPVDAIFLSPGTEIGVLERGSVIRIVRDQGQRCLILGLGSFSSMTQDQVAAILAHEYGHFNHHDTAGGDTIRMVQRSLNHMAINLASAGLAAWYNPAWWFIFIYNRIFLQVTLGASRLQEILADRAAALVYGAPSLVGGLKQLVRQKITFALQVDAEVKQAAAQHRGLHNLYTLPPVEDSGDLEMKLAEATSHPHSPYHSHPSPDKRLAYIEGISSETVQSDDPRPAWELINNAGQIQEELTLLVEQKLRRGGQLV